MENQMKKIVSVVLAAVLFACMPGVAIAAQQASADMSEDTIVTPMYLVISDVSCQLNISANGVANMSATISCMPGVNKIRMVQNLQRYDGGWQTIGSWSQYYYSSSANWSQSRSVTSGSYRLFVYFYAYKGTTLLESTYRNSTDSY